ncbi:ABC transporter substrate-binding protein [Paenibacillus elgii]
MHRRTWLSLLLLLAIAGVIAGCTASDPGTGASGDPKKSGGTAAQASFPRTIKHMKGETVIKERPVKIAAPYLTFVDDLVVLDEIPIAAQGMTMMSSFPNLQKKLEGKPVIDLGKEVSMERLLASQPDLIIASDDMADKYEQLSQIAPTVIFPYTEDWKGTLQLIAGAIGKEEKAAAFLADFDRKAKEYKAKLASRSGETVLFAMYGGKEFITFNEQRVADFYKELGLKPVPGNEKGGSLSLETLATMNPDHIFIVNNYATPIKQGVEEMLKDNAIWNGMKAPKSNQVYYIEDTSILGPMPLGKMIAIEEVMKAMGNR